MPNPSLLYHPFLACYLDYLVAIKSILSITPRLRYGESFGISRETKPPVSILDMFQPQR